MSIAYTIKKNDNLTRIAVEYGFGANWQAIYNHELNAKFREQFPDPHLITAGTTIRIPDCGLRRMSVEQGKSICLEARPVTNELILEALAVHAAYCKLLDDLHGIQSEPEVTIATFAEAFAEDKDCAKGLDQARLDAFKKAHKIRCETQAAEIEGKHRRLQEIMSLPQFDDEMSLLEPEWRARVVGELWQRANESGAGRRGIILQVEEPSSAWHTHVLPVAKKTADVFFELLAEFTPTIVRIKDRSYLLSLIHAHSDVLPAHLNSRAMTVGYVWKESLRVEEIRVNVLEVQVQRLPASLDAFKSNVDKAFSVINFAFAMKDLFDGQPPDVREALVASGAVADLVDNFTTSYVASVKTTKSFASRSASHTTTVLKGPNATVTVSKVHNRVLASQSTRIGLKVTGKIFGIVGGIIGAVVDGMDAADNWSKGDIDAAIANGIAAASGVGVTILSVLVLAGVGSSWAGIGLVILFIAGLFATILAIFLEDPPHVEWVKNCLFGTSWDDDLDRQFHELAVLISVGQVKGRFTGDPIDFTFEPVFVGADAALNISLLSRGIFRAERGLLKEFFLGPDVQFISRPILEEVAVQLRREAEPIDRGMSGVWVEVDGSRLVRVRTHLSSKGASQSSATVGGKMVAATTRWRALLRDVDAGRVKLLAAELTIQVDPFNRWQWAEHRFEADVGEAFEFKGSRLLRRAPGEAG